jgi:hypothetical protein
MLINKKNSSNFSLSKTSQPKKKKGFKTFINGMFSGLTSRTLVAPFERVIILQQTSQTTQFSEMGNQSM